MTTKSSPPASRGKTRSPTKEIARQQSSAPIRLKTVVRRLPPNLPESVFWQSVESWVSDETASWKIFYQGKFRKRLNKENIPSRAYVLFKTEESLTSFSREYDGHVFRDKQGNESHAVVEFAPNQKVPPEKKKVDTRHATIQQDEDYISFITALQNPPARSVELDIDALLASTIPPEEPKTTPLLAALREQKISAQEKKLAASEASKAHSRKGGVTSAPPPKPEAVDPAPVPTGKKGKKAKGAQTAGSAAPQSSTASGANPSATKSSSGRNRSGQAPAPSTASASSASSASASTAKEPAATSSSSAESEQQQQQQQQTQAHTQKRNRPMVGLHSRHLKAALSGAGVQLAPHPSPSSGSSPAPAAGPSVSAAAASAASTSAAGTPSHRPRGRGGAGEKRTNEQAKDGNVKDAGGGRGGGGGGKDKARSRHPPAASRPPEAPPRILSRQDPPPPSLTIGDAGSKDRVPAGGPQDPGVGRGRGGRRGRGQ